MTSNSETDIWNWILSMVIIKSTTHCVSFPVPIQNL